MTKGNNCVSCTNNCCESMHHIYLFYTDIVKILDYLKNYCFESTNLSKGSGIIKINDRSVLQIGVFNLEGSNPTVGGIISNPCFFYRNNKCILHEEEVKDSKLAELLKEDNASMNVKPLLCRLYPYGYDLEKNIVFLDKACSCQSFNTNLVFEELKSAVKTQVKIYEELYKDFGIKVLVELAGKI